ncbi:hypothetical protein WJX72_010755 [[Myrmecia] bisecta]|uniref:RRM domain-containing protein n=1 Tax=[Myrmecia] bisecta TaxID=41462 RepID=A0AAW1QGE5_9CHLO
MQRGKRKSPFIGKTEPLSSAAQPILYSRYNDLSDILLVPQATATQAQQPDAGSELSKKKQKQQKGVVAATKVVSGPSNAEEAKVIRQALGIDPAKPDSTKAPQTFAFGFSLASTSGVDEAAATAADEENRAAGTAEEGGEAAEAGQPASASAAPAGPDGQATTIDLDSADPATRARLQRIMGVEAPAGLERRVFVGGMPFSYEEEDIREYWSYCGEIEDLDIMRFPDTGRFKGIAFITFATVEGYQAALECDGEMLDSTRLKVEKCISAGRKEGRAARKQAEKERPVHAMPAPKTPGYHVAYVGNIAFEAIAKDLEAVFEDCKVTLVRLHTDRDTGKSKGYAHVHFADEESLDRAIEFSGAELMGRAIKIGYAQPKRP